VRGNDEPAASADPLCDHTPTGGLLFRLRKKGSSHKNGSGAERKRRGSLSRVTGSGAGGWSVGEPAIPPALPCPSPGRPPGVGAGGRPPLHGARPHAVPRVPGRRAPHVRRPLPRPPRPLHLRRPISAGGPRGRPAGSPLRIEHWFPPRISIKVPMHLRPSKVQR